VVPDALLPPITSPLRSASLSPGLVESRLPDNGKLPRLVTVKQTFNVTLHDELHVREGETLRLLQEFQDGWTLCQRVGRPDAEKGAVPKCCLAERLQVKPARKASTSFSTPPGQAARPMHKISASTSQIPTVAALKQTEPLALTGRQDRRGSLIIGINHIQHPKLRSSP